MDKDKYYYFKLFIIVIPLIVMTIDRNFHYHSFTMFQNTGVLMAAIFGIPIVASTGLLYNFFKGKRKNPLQTPLKIYVASAIVVSGYILYMTHL